MAASLPAKLKANADIARFAQRAAQLEQVKPAIAYWCEYWIVNQLIARGLHNTDSECLQYTSKLMDKLEQTKSKYADDDAIIDDTAGQAYVEQFGLETFERADRAVQANKITKQTADTFLAASTFLELLNIWGEADQEIQAKLRYAKWNALRIVKAIKEGKDPNESNPAPEPQPEEAQGQASESELQQLGDNQSHPPPPTAEDAPDEQDLMSPHLAAQSLLNKSLHPSQEPSRQNTPPTASHPGPPPQLFNPSASQTLSPIAPSPSAAPKDRSGSIGGGYFPEVPTDTRDIPAVPTTFPTHLSPTKSPKPSVISPPHEQSTFPTFPTVDYTPNTGHTDQTIDSYYSQSPPQPPAPAPPAQAAYNAPPVSTIAAPVGSTLPPRPVSSAPRPQAAVVLDDVAVAKAQKHARWAISALNFEDSETAIRELRAALETLGAQ
ncbi:hypothetical protein VC83_06579 [Pseudogymnoascus destructans]|uniref:Vacuolar protein sorting-associated protein vta1 n=2 Tax=Pseudogymnoascus destructans TaxID=655981 RepID=L8FV08_PSED2|nr:uncharacterized protein VC83_06579 [Pseudogymnoascus destructans]ELR04374.1 hypothetical protein GMDG_06743 [Pseudogymnoascus destructans 20631-21]OAF58223.1 hypothetical protein VC83_06579 [Pseudogymnoascus destructans]